MKRVAMLCLILCTLISTCLIVPTAAADSATSLDSHMIIHYDFEGATIEEQLKDKATAGSSSDNLVYNGTDAERAEKLSIANGVAHLKGFAGLMADFRDANKSTAGADLPNNTTGEYTYYFDFKVYGDGASKGGFRDFFNLYEFGTSGGIAQRWIRLYFGNCSANGTKDLSFVSPGTGGTAKVLTTIPAIDGNFVQIAVTMKWDATTSKWNYKGYMSMDQGQNYYMVMEYSADNAENYLAAAHALCLGNRSQNANVAVEYDYDDVRVYNKALTAEELVSIKNPAAEETTTEEVTTESATTENTDTTTEEATTEASTTENGDTTSTNADADNDKKSGCSSSVVLGATTMIAFVAGACLVMKKKKD